MMFGEYLPWIGHRAVLDLMTHWVDKTLQHR